MGSVIILSAARGEEAYCTGIVLLVKHKTKYYSFILYNSRLINRTREIILMFTVLIFVLVIIDLIEDAN